MMRTKWLEHTGKNWLFAFVVLLTGATAAAATSWKLPPPATGDWFEPTNWTYGVPTASGKAYIANSGTALISGGDAKAKYFYLGHMGEGRLVQSGGANTAHYVYIAYGTGAKGTYELSGGEFNSTYMVFGQAGWLERGGTGRFIQTGGTHLGGQIHLGVYYGYTVPGDVLDSEGWYELSDGVLSATQVIVGQDWFGSFKQTGGEATIHTLRVGEDQYAYGIYKLGAGGTLKTTQTWIGCSGGEGHFVQTGGLNEVDTEIGIGCSSDASYNLSAGTLRADTALIANSGQASFTQTGGNVELSSFYIAKSGTANYEMHGGTLSTEKMYLPRYTAYSGARIGRVLQVGGKVEVTDTLTVGSPRHATGYYELGGTAELSAGSAYIASSGTGTFTQTGGKFTINDTLAIAHYNDTGIGSLTISGGELNTAKMLVAGGGSGLLAISNAEASITVSENLYFGANSRLSTVPGATIHMTGSALENESTDPGALGGLNNLRLIFEGGPADIDPYEAAGEDMGAVMVGFDYNFALGTLQLGSDEGTGQLRVVDNYDNCRSWVGSEALYTENFFIGAGSYIDLNGLNLYYLRAQIDPASTILLNGGNLTQVYLPATIDIRPGSDPNSINLLAKGMLPVAILGSEMIDVAVIDQTTLALGGSSPQERGKSGRLGAFEDVNGDGFLDLVVRFAIGEMELDPDATEAELTGLLLDGTGIFGTDAVRLVGGKAIDGATLQYTPEPATLVLLGIGGLALLKRRSQRRAARLEVRG